MAIEIDRSSTRNARLHPRAENSSRGQALVETGLVVLGLFLLLLAVVEFGRGFMIANVVTNAARAGARMAALTPPAARDPDGLILDTAPIEAQVRSIIAQMEDPNSPFSTGLTIAVAQTDGTVPIVEVSVIGDVPSIFSYQGAINFPMNRSVTFPDQGRRTGAP